MGKEKKRVWPLIIIIVGVILLAGFISFSVYAGSVLNKDTVYDGVYVGDVHVGGLSTEEVRNALYERFNDQLDDTITIAYEELSETVSLKDMEANLDYDRIVSNVYMYGREGTVLSRLKKVTSLPKEPVVFVPAISYDESFLSSVITEMSASIDQEGQPTDVQITDEALIVTPGVAGRQINIPGTLIRFSETATTVKDDIFYLELEDITPDVINAKDLYQTYGGTAQDATYQVENHRLVIIDEKPGVIFNVEKAQEIIDQTQGKVITIPATVTRPKLTAEQLKKSLFTDLLGTYSSKYNAKDTARSYNVSLAAQKINEVVLSPGETFSYNEIVGPRTVERGFKVANVYVGNRIEPGVGGGICQVSSTLFNAAILANMKIVTRTNHSLPVSYVPMGQDATVSYGTIDFKFLNSTSSPVKIVASAVNGQHTVSIYGVNEEKNITIEIKTEQVGVTPFTTVQKEDPTLPEGTIKVEQEGVNGSAYRTYKIMLVNGKIAGSELLCKSTYVPTERIELVGTKPVSAPVSGPATTPEVEQPVQEPAPEPTATPTPQPPAEVVETPEPTFTPISPNQAPVISGWN